MSADASSIRRASSDARKSAGSENKVDKSRLSGSRGATATDCSGN